MVFRRIVLIGILLVVFLTSSPTAAPDFSGWSAAVSLGSVVNSPVFDSGPTLSKDRRSLYFVSNRAGGLGGNDIWVSQRSNVEAPWGLPINLGPAINTSVGEAQPALSRDGHLLFFASNRPGGFGSVDVWVSYREDVHDDFSWQLPVNLGPGVNSPEIEQDPDIASDRETLYYRSNRAGAISGNDLFVTTRTKHE